MTKCSVSTPAIRHPGFIIMLITPVILFTKLFTHRISYLAQIHRHINNLGVGITGARNETVGRDVKG